MGILIVWAALSLVAGVIAENKGRSGIGFFFLALVFSPLIGIPAALVAKADTASLEKRQIKSGQARKCPYCAELIRPDAVVCKHCGRDLPQEESASSQDRRVPPHF